MTVSASLASASTIAMLLLAGVLFLVVGASNSYVHRYSCRQTPRPHIIIILADDLGWNDISLHGSNQYLTPNIDALGLSGISLHNYYTQPICTPARAALLTGRHPIHTGMENDVLYAPQPWGLPLAERLLPQYLSRVNYRTHALGKWHLGFFKLEYTPTQRGFESHYGNWLGAEDHFTHFAYPAHPGFDFRRNLNSSWEAQGFYTTDLLTDEAVSIINNHNASDPLFLYMPHVAPHAPLQAPQDVIDSFSYIPDKRRRTFAAMVAKLDESVGRVVETLKDKDMLNNSIILFLTDNGGATHGFNGNVASNFPLRGCKDTLWEGGVRGVGLMWSPLLQAVPRVHQGFVNVQDWLPTLLDAADVPMDCGDPTLDGVSQWSALNGRSPSPYNMILHNIDPVRKIAAMRYGPWKIVIGRTYNGKYDGFYGKLNGKVPYNIDTIRSSAAGVAIQSTPTPLPTSDTILTLRAESTISCNSSPNLSYCQPNEAPCLFNIEEDPCETQNLASSNPDMVMKLIGMLEAYNLAPPNNKPADPRSYPEHWNNTWINWLDYV